jgi:hypothetical protein
VHDSATAIETSIEAGLRRPPRVADHRHCRLNHRGRPAALDRGVERRVSFRAARRRAPSSAARFDRGRPESSLIGTRWDTDRIPAARAYRHRFSATGDADDPPEQSCPPLRAVRRSCTTRSNIGFISRGGPGSSTIALRPRSTHSPGAVLFGFGSTVALRGTIACRRLISGIVIP